MKKQPDSPTDHRDMDQKKEEMLTTRVGNFLVLWEEMLPNFDYPDTERNDWDKRIQDQIEAYWNVTALLSLFEEKRERLKTEIKEAHAKYDEAMRRAVKGDELEKLQLASMQCNNDLLLTYSFIDQAHKLQNELSLTMLHNLGWSVGCDGPFEVWPGTKTGFAVKCAEGYERLEEAAKTNNLSEGQYPSFRQFVFSEHRRHILPKSFGKWSPEDAWNLAKQK